MEKHAIWYVVFLVLLVIVAVLGSGCSGTRDNATPGTMSPVTTTPTRGAGIQTSSTTSSGSGTPSPPALSFEGDGSDETTTFTHGAGTARLTYTHSGTGAFEVWLLDEDGYEIDLLVEEYGRVSDWTNIEFDEWGLYSLGVDADGEWTLDIT